MSLATTYRISEARPWRWPNLARARWLSPVALLLLWELGARVGVIPPRVLAAPSTVLETFWSLTASGELPKNLLVSLARAGAGLGIALVLATVLGLIGEPGELDEQSEDR